MPDEGRTEKLLATLLVHMMGDVPQKEKAVALDRSGFSTVEIADLLGTTAATIKQQLYEARKAGTKKKAKPRGKSAT